MFYWSTCTLKADINFGIFRKGSVFDLFSHRENFSESTLREKCIGNALGINLEDEIKRIETSFVW